MELGRSSQSFEREVLAEPGAEHLYRCYSCGTCASACLVRRVNPDFNPRRILEMVMLGMKEEVLSSPVVWLCSACDLCYDLCPQQIHISDLMKAIRNIAIREGYEPPGPVAVVDEELCSGCGMCATVCPYEAIELVAAPASGNGHTVAQVDKFWCMDCGSCTATCPSEAIRIEGFSREKVAIRMQADGWLRSEIEPKIVLFICNWCLRAAEDLVRLDQFPSHVRVVHVPCTGQVDHSLVLSALTGGADGVLVVGCQPGECHYRRGNLLERRRVLEAEPLLQALGIGSERLRLEWISTSERAKIEGTVRAFTQAIERLGPNPLNGRGR
ncbi:MAG: hydrogenase iron-sulfur subunit [Anaerolineae bacterium]|jgi:coenzyme F420-reducing hydrogenase delta subunit/Pyruvate/2-oxoacid:ferredoxin oxidoreductase delta subunit